MRIAIVGHIRLYREGLAYALSKNAAMEVVTVAANLMDVTELLRSQSVDVVLIDAAAPGYLDLGQQLHELFSVILVGLAIEEVDNEVIACAEAGFCSYVPRDASVNQLADTIHAAAKGQLYCPPNIAGLLLRRISTLASNRSQDMKIPHLTARELEIARLLELGLSNKEIARDLSIEISTAKNHVHNLLEKLQVHRRGAAVARLRHILQNEQSYSDSCLT